MKLNINPGPIFICGPIKGDIELAEKQFNEAHQLLSSLRLESINQFALFSKNGIGMENLKFTMFPLIKCNTVVTLPFWAGCEFAKRQVDIARLLDIEIIDYSRFTAFKNQQNG